MVNTRKNLKVCVIGDIHGRDVWKDIVQDDKFDKIIFNHNLSLKI